MMPRNEKLPQLHQALHLLRIMRRPYRLEHSIAIGLVDDLNAYRARSVALLADKHGGILGTGHPNQQYPTNEPLKINDL